MSATSGGRTQASEIEWFSGIRVRNEYSIVCGKSRRAYGGVLIAEHKWAKWRRRRRR